MRPGRRRAGALLLIVSWNVAGRVRALEEQAHRVRALGAEVVCLQETSPSTAPLWEALLREAGYDGVCHAPAAPDGVRKRPLMVLTAARTRLDAETVAGVPWPERVLAARTADGMLVVNVHSPISAKPGRVKLLTHLAVHAHLARHTEEARILCGDLNTPRRELEDGTVWTFARDRYGRLREDRGEEWERAELSLLRGLEPYGFCDSFRSVHGYGRREISWGWARWKGGYRLDHLLVAGLGTEQCRYEHEWREEGLSDHAPLIATLAPRTRERVA